MVKNRRVAFTGLEKELYVSNKLSQTIWTIIRETDDLQKVLCWRAWISSILRFVNNCLKNMSEHLKTSQLYSNVDVYVRPENKSTIV